MRSQPDYLQIQLPPRPAGKRGVRAIRNEYDDAGLLISSTDAAGKTAEFTHDLVARTETVTDRLGHVTVYDYDAAGNVPKQTDSLGHSTTFTYDAFGNQLTKTDPLGRTTTSDIRHPPQPAERDQPPRAEDRVHLHVAERDANNHRSAGPGND